MGEALPATSREEIPAFFVASGHKLFGIFTQPTATAVGVAVVVLTGGGIALSTNRNRLSVRLCRRAAALGYHAMRFDYHGVGESEGEVEGFRLDEPFVNDLMGAINWIGDRGIRRFVLVGSCFGGRTALSCAPRIDGLQGLVVISAPVDDFEMDEAVPMRLATTMSLWGFARRAVRPRVIRGLLDPDRRRTYFRIIRAKLERLSGGRGGRVGGAIRDFHMSRMFIEPLTALARRAVPVLLLYGEEEEEWREFRRAKGPLGELLADAPSSIEVLTLSGSVHGFTRISAQDAVLEAVISWLDRRVASRTAGLGREGPTIVAIHDGPDPR